MRPWMEKRMNGKMRPAFTQRRLFARRCVGVGHRQERRSQGAAAGPGGPFFATRRGRGVPAHLPARLGCAQMAPAPAVRAALAAPAPPAPFGHDPRSDSPNAPTPIPYREGFQGPDAGLSEPDQSRDGGQRHLCQEMLG